MNKYKFMLGTSTLALASFTALAQPLLVTQLTRNGELQWDDIASVFVQAKSYTVEWAPGVGNTGSAWKLLTEIPATNTAYSVEVPMIYRVRAEVEGRFPKLSIAVFSDLHYFEPSLLVHDGPAFQAYLAIDRKLLKESQAIIDQMTAEVKLAKPDLVFVSGDLTKDGELICHQGVIERLRQLKDGGAQVFVIPGNHDIHNPHAFSYDGANKTPVSSVSEDEFVSLYGDFGYAKAIARDPNSRSYVAEPVPGLWLLAMDACHPERNTNGMVFDGGYFDAPRLSWITSQLAAARSQGKFVIGMMHPGVQEHFVGQKTLYPDFVIDDYEAVAQLLADYGVKLVFTGHFHAQDVVHASVSRGALYDIQTGSAVTFPCPYRLLSLGVNGDLTITSHLITNINYDLGGVPFPQYASNDVYSASYDIAYSTLKNPPYNLPDASAQFLAPAMAEAFVSHNQGDEGSRPISAPTQQTIAYLLSQPDPLYQMMAGILLALFNDPPPADNALSINLIKGIALP